MNVPPRTKWDGESEVVYHAAVDFSELLRTRNVAPSTDGLAKQIEEVRRSSDDFDTFIAGLVGKLVERDRK